MDAYDVAQVPSSRHTGDFGWCLSVYETAEEVNLGSHSV